MEFSTFKKATKELFDDIVKTDENIYLYHYIVAKTMENKYVLINNINDLLDLKNVVCKYYVTKVHYLSEPSPNLFEVDGDLCYIEKLGYFFIHGYNKSNDNEIIKEFQNYEKDFDRFDFEFNDKEFLDKNI